MPLKIGEWKMNENGVEATLNINNVNPDNGEVRGSIGGAIGEVVGVWDETSRTITPLAHPISLVPLPVALHYHRRGFIRASFSARRVIQPGQDVVWTLAGSVQPTDLAGAVGTGGNAMRTVFGWFAQITEVG
jgi:hypothetical protein